MSDHPRPLRTCLVLCSCFFAVGAYAAPMSAQLTTSEKSQLQREARLVVDLVQNYHYSGSTFTGVSNPEILGRFLSELDPRADIFTPDEVAFLHRRFDRTLKTVYLFRGDLQPAFEVFDTFAALADERLKWIERRISQPFDFTVDESYAEPAKDAPPVLDAPLDRRWELRLKEQLITAMLAGRTLDQARETLRQYYAEARQTMTQFDSFAVRERFLDVTLRCFDPHSGYFSADSTRTFSAVMAGNVVGVGLELRRERGRAVVTALQPGAPADLHSTIAPGDTIEALAVGDGPWVETAALRGRETLALLHGPRGGKVRVAYRNPADLERKEVTLERDRIVLVGERARGSVLTVATPSGAVRKIGCIFLPTFYGGGKGEQATSAAADIRDLLQAMDADKITGLVIDLRTNPGGTLTEASAISQLFLPGGVMMLGRRPDGALDELRLKDSPPMYSGPLVVLTSPASASASEIFAAAMKFHHRALIVGGPATFGKGSSQAYIDLAKSLHLKGDEVKDWGTLRLTTNRFYAPDGSAIQGTGVAPDVVIPLTAPPKMEAESKLPHAFAVERVTPPPANDVVPDRAPALPDSLREKLVTSAAAHLVSLPEWELWRKEAQALESMTKPAPHSLVLETRRKEWQARIEDQAVQLRRRRELTEKEKFPSHPVEISAVTLALNAHQEKLRAQESTGLGHLRDHAFLVRTDQGRLRALRLAQFSFETFLGDAPVLAADLSQDFGLPVTPEQARTALLALAVLDEKTDTAALAILQKIGGPAIKATVVQSALDHWLGRMVALDANLASERIPFDIPLRESARLAAAWAETLPAPGP